MIPGKDEPTEAVVCAESRGGVYNGIPLAPSSAGEVLVKKGRITGHQVGMLYNKKP